MAMSWILGGLILVADIYVMLKIADSDVSQGKKTLWFGLVLLLPILGLIAWYLAGPGRPE